MSGLGGKLCQRTSRKLPANLSAITTQPLADLPVYISIFGSEPLGRYQRTSLVLPANLSKGEEPLVFLVRQLRGYREKRSVRAETTVKNRGRTHLFASQPLYRVGLSYLFAA